MPSIVQYNNNDYSCLDSTRTRSELRCNAPNSCYENELCLRLWKALVAYSIISYNKIDDRTNNIFLSHMWPNWVHLGALGSLMRTLRVWAIKWKRCEQCRICRLLFKSIYVTCSWKDGVSDTLLIVHACGVSLVFIIPNLECLSPAMYCVSYCLVLGWGNMKPLCGMNLESGD